MQTEYAGRIEQDQKQELEKKKATFSKSFDNNLIKAYHIVLKYTSKGEMKKMEIARFANDFAIQVDTNIVEALKDDEWLLDAVGKGTLGEHNLLPTIERPVRTNDLYEAFLRYDDKPMIRQIEAIRQSILKYYMNGEFNIAYGDAFPYTRIYHKEDIPYFDVTDPQFRLVDKSVYPVKVTEEPKAAESHPASIVTPSTPDTADAQPKRFKALTISGKVPLERYTDLFSSFVVPLKNNHIEIEVRFKAKSTDSYPLTESVQIYKSVKESAKQLGLNLTEEV